MIFYISTANILCIRQLKRQHFSDLKIISSTRLREFERPIFCVSCDQQQIDIEVALASSGLGELLVNLPQKLKNYLKT